MQHRSHVRYVLLFLVSRYASKALPKVAIMMCMRTSEDFNDTRESFLSCGAILSLSIPVRTIVFSTRKRDSESSAAKGVLE